MYYSPWGAKSQTRLSDLTSLHHNQRFCLLLHLKGKIKILSCIFLSKYSPKLFSIPQQKFQKELLIIAVFLFLTLTACWFLKHSLVYHQIPGTSPTKNHKSVKKVPIFQFWFDLSAVLEVLYHSDVCYSLIWNLFAPFHFLDPLSPPKLLPCHLQINNTVISTPSFQYFEK